MNAKSDNLFFDQFKAILLKSNAFHTTINNVKPL